MLDYTASRYSIKEGDNDYQLDQGVNRNQKPFLASRDQSYSNDPLPMMSCSIDSYQGPSASSGLLRVDLSGISENEVVVKALKSHNVSGHRLVGATKTGNSGEVYFSQRHNKDWRTRKA